MNGSTRWIRVGGIYLASHRGSESNDEHLHRQDYVVRRAQEVRSNYKVLTFLAIVMLLTVGLIIAEPDLGCDSGNCGFYAGCILLGRRTTDSIRYCIWCNSFSLYFPDCLNHIVMNV